jgi:hypothetical protein
VKYEGLIRRARELAALADHSAVPDRIGLEQVPVGEICSDGTGSWEGYEDTSEIVAIPEDGPAYEIGHADTVPLARLWAAAPDMARLLAEMAEVLESVWEKAIQDAIDAITCKSCNGRGRITNNPNSQECPVCGGSGTIDDPLAEMAHNE